MLDNVKFHYSRQAIELIEQGRVSVLHLQVHIPNVVSNYQRSKLCFGHQRPEQIEPFRQPWQEQLKKVAIDDACGWFANCGYTYSLK